MTPGMASGPEERHGDCGIGGHIACFCAPEEPRDRAREDQAFPLDAGNETCPILRLSQRNNRAYACARFLMDIRAQ